MTSTFEERLDKLHLPRLLLVGLPAKGSISRTDLEESTRSALKELHASLARIEDHPEVADMELFGSIARQVTSSADETEKAARLMRPLFERAVRVLKADIQDELGKYVHADFFAQVTPRLRIPNNPVHLMRLAFPKTKPANQGRLRQMWESRLLYFIALQSLAMLFRDDPTYREQLLTMIDDDDDDNDDEYANGYTDAYYGQQVINGPIKDTGKTRQKVQEFRVLRDTDDMNLVIEYMIAQGLIEDEGEDQQWYVYLDPNDEHRWTDTRVGMLRRRFNIRVCKIKGKEIKFGVQARRKRLFSRWRKWVARIGRVGQFTPDQVGVRFVFQSESDYREGKSWFRNHLGVLPGGSTARVKIDRNETGVSASDSASTSPFASEKFAADRIHVTIRNRLVELQMMSVTVAANVTYSTGEENNQQYGYRRIQPFLEILRPEALYGINWSDPEVIDKNKRHVHEDIRARLNLT